jgi:UDP-2-acetamido-3-amino-2,3-dideoxy-glucuronate N-acetyltransferase
MSRHGHRLRPAQGNGSMVCPESGFRYELTPAGTLRCLDLEEDKALPPALAKGSKEYRTFKKS